ncbi:unnamed protein product [Ectocarpus sp. 13 AM-2016]
MAPVLNALAILAVVASSTSAFVVTPGEVRPRSLTAAAAGSTATARRVGGGADTSSRRSRRAPASLLRSSETTAEYELDEKELRGPLTPVEDTVMVKVDKQKAVTEGGVFLPKMKNVKITRGTVTAVGEGKRHWDTGVKIPITVEVGERVVYGNFDGTSVQYQGSEHLLMRDTELLMAYEGEEVSCRA